MPRRQPGVLTVFPLLVLVLAIGNIEPRFVGAAAAAPVAGDAFFFCAGQPISAHWNEVASGKLLSQLNTPLNTFVDNPAAVVDTGAKLYRFFHQHEYPNQANYTVFSYSFASPPLHLASTCDFSLPSSASQLGCATVDPASGQVFFTTTDGGGSRVTLWRFDSAKCSVQSLSSVNAPLNIYSFAQCVYVPLGSSGVVAFYNMELLHNDDRPSIIFLDTDTSGAKTRKTYIYPRLPVFSEAPYSINLATDGKDLLWMGQVGRNYSAAVSITTDGAATQLFSNPNVEVGLKTVAYAQDNLLVLHVWQPSVLLDRRGNVLWRSSAPLEGSSKCPMIAGLAFH